VVAEKERDPYTPLSEEASIVSLTIPAKAEYIALVRLALVGLARTRALGEDVVGDLKLALTEACSNSIRHAYAGNQEGTVEVRYGLTSDRMAIEISDAGTGFDPTAGREGNGELDEGGLGIAIIRALVDDLEIGSGPDGSRIRFVKRLA
jgi:serine/threonine-protein kinase RsbW